jgi:hypothetical protein
VGRKPTAHNKLSLTAQRKPMGKSPITKLRAKVIRVVTLELGNQFLQSRSQSID